MAELATFEDLRKSDEDFYLLLRTVADTFVRKNHDYTSHGLFGPGSNLTRCEEFDVPAWKGVLIRLGDKWSRLTTFAKKGLLQVKDESVEDTFLDMAIYSLLGVLAYRRARNADTSGPLVTHRPPSGDRSGVFMVTTTTPADPKKPHMGLEARELTKAEAAAADRWPNEFPPGFPLHEVPSALAVQPPVPTPTERR